MRNKSIKFALAYEILKVKQEDEAFFIGDAGKGIIRVLSFEVHDEFRELMVITETFHRLG